jgi:catechol 2,3-dioxygenase-like lactoylglutathione lyase family enzyme
MRILSILLALFFAAIAIGQTPQLPSAPASDVVIGSGSFSPIVADLEKSLAFYNDLLGGTPGATPAWGADPPLLNFLGVPGSQVRVGNVRIPGSATRVEIVEFKDVERKPVQPRLQDPGAVRLILIVRDIDRLLTHLKERGAPVVTRGGLPVNFSTGSSSGRGVVVKDPDGHFIQLLQPDVLPETTAPATANVIDARFGLTIEDTDKTVRLYRDVLGFQPTVAPAFVNDKSVSEMMDTPGAQVRLSSATVPGSRLEVELAEFKGIDRKAIGARVQDPGATRLQLRVKDTDAAVKALVASGGTVITTGGNGGPIDMQGLRVALVRELNNLFLVTMAQGQQPARPAR